MGGIVDAGGEMADSVAQPDMPEAPENAAGLDDPGHAGLDDPAHAGFDDPGHGPWWMRAPSDPPGSGAYPIVPDDPSGTGGFPIVQDGPSNTGGFSIVSGDLPGTGGFPVVHDEPVASGGYPIVTDESLASGGYPVVPQDSFNSGGYPIIPEGSLNSGGYPVLAPGPQTSGGYPVMPSAKVAKKRSKAGAFGAILAVGAGLLIILVAGYLIFRPTAGGGAQAPVQKKRVVAAAGVAGGLNKTTALPAATAAYPFVMAGVRAAGADGPGNAVGVYSAPLVGPQQLLFVGGATDTGDPLAFVHKIKPSTTLTTTGEAPGKGGGQSVCGTFQVLSDVHVYCAWATKGSFGVIATNMPTPIPDIAGMAALMGKMRGDLDTRF